MVQKFLRLEGLLLAILAFIFYLQIGGNIFLFILLFLIPDISMIGYFRDSRTGAIIYNLIHNYALALLISGIGHYIFNNSLITAFGLILFTHAALDRFFGYGLKYPEGFKKTHMQRL